MKQLLANNHVCQWQTWKEKNQNRDKINTFSPSSCSTSQLNNLFAMCLTFVSTEDQLPPGFPTIDMGPQLKVVERTRTATMLCAASGNPDPDISWFKDFLPVNTTNNNGRIKQLRSGRFSLDDSLMMTRGGGEGPLCSLSLLPPSLPPNPLSVLSSSTFSHDLTSHLAFHFCR